MPEVSYVYYFLTNCGNMPHLRAWCRSQVGNFTKQYTEGAVVPGACSIKKYGRLLDKREKYLWQGKKLARPRGVQHEVVGGCHYIQCRSGNIYAVPGILSTYRSVSRFVLGAYVELAANKTVGLRIPTLGYVKADLMTKTISEYQHCSRK